MSTFDQLYDQALDLFDQQQYERCLVLLDQALLLEPENVDCYYARGNTRYEMGDLQGAVAEYLWALKYAPYFVSALNNLGNTYEVLKQYEKSIVQYQRALEINPENGTLHYNLGVVYLTLGRLSDSLGSLNKAIELEPEIAAAYLNRANVLSRLAWHEEALADYQKALQLAPNDSNIAWTALWSQFGREGLTDAQVAELERISQLDPTHYTSYCCQAVLALQRKDGPAALLHLEQAVTMEPEQWDPHFWIGIVAALDGESEVARRAIERSLELGLPPLLLTPLAWLKKEQSWKSKLLNLQTSRSFEV